MSGDWDNAIKKAFKVVFDDFERRMIQKGNDYVISVSSYDSMKKLLMGEQQNEKQ